MHLSVAGLSFTYPRARRAVLSDVNLEIPSGTAAAIVGPSGSGKTTLLALVGGLIPLPTGRITALDDDGAPHPVPEVASWVMQTVSLLPDRTALDNVKIGAFSAGVDDVVAERRARTALDEVDLIHRAGSVARSLSGGEAQRVAVARALASHRPVLLADEPTGQLDASSSATVVDALVGHHGERTLLVVTHDLEVAKRCSLVLELRDGSIVERERA